MSFFFKKNKNYKIVVLGAGKLARHLAPALEAAGHQITAVYSRRPWQAEGICDNLYEAKAVHSLDFSASQAEIYILAVADDAIETVASAINLPENTLLLHTSGARPMHILSRATAQIGVLYPLQTFSTDKIVNFRHVPFLVEAGSEASLKKVRQIAESLSERVEETDSHRRQVLHVAAVFACNFSNHLMHLAEQLVAQEGLEFGMLKPLIEETFTKALQISPAKSQTGPAIRNDQLTMDEHIKLLQQQDPALAGIYRMLSRSIQRHNKS